MACNTCFTSCLIHPCYDNLWIGKATANNNYLVKVTNIGSGRVVSEQVTATSAGLVKLTGGTWNDFFNSGSQFEFKLFQMDFSQVPNVTSNIPVDFYAITGFTGAYYSITLTFSSTVYDCALVSFEMLYDSDGSPIEIDNQYLFDENA